ncbi:MAG: 2-phosphosulfolactate phosphatase [Ruminococcaceae bacterium]|nr:2-phosphosulfolactate phosphatase [Oscillospiraceae bacterium]
MKINILHMIDGAKKAKGTTVIIDVFRAFSVEAYCFYMGAEKIIPVGDAKLAYRLKEKNPEYILSGERHGKILPDFDVGNSPTDIVKLDLKGKTVIHTTSAGTQGIVNAVGADEIIGGSLLCAKAIARYIKKTNKKEVSLVCMGLDALSETEEDNLCANYIKSLLCDEEIDIRSEIEKLKITSGAKFFDKTQKDVFPESDFHMCVEVDKFDFLVKLEKDIDGTCYMKRYDF